MSTIDPSGLICVFQVFSNGSSKIISKSSSLSSLLLSSGWLSVSVVSGSDGPPINGMNRFLPIHVPSILLGLRSPKGQLSRGILHVFQVLFSSWLFPAHQLLDLEPVHPHPVFITGSPTSPSVMTSPSTFKSTSIP